VSDRCLRRWIEGLGAGFELQRAGVKTRRSAFSMLLTDGWASIQNKEKAARPAAPEKI
jgi:hypothetical protein